MIRILQSGDEAALEQFLLPRLVSSMFLLSNSRVMGVAEGQQPYQGRYVAEFQDGKIVGVVAHYWNGMLIMQMPHPSPALCQMALDDSDRPLKGVLGPNTQVTAVLSSLNIPPDQIRLDDTEKQYSLSLAELIVPPALQDGTVQARLSTQDDLDLIAGWRVDMALESMGAEASPKLQASHRNSAQHYIHEKRSWILEKDGVPVAKTAFNATLSEAVQVGGVWTPPENRSRGYARCAVAASLLDARAAGVQQAILFTAEANFAAQKAYTALGFTHIGDYRIILLK